jgi:tRNA(Ile)-lysidine synthase
MRLRRGTTLAGLRGIQETRELFDVECEMWNEKEITTHYAPHITHFIYRPLLNTTRAELLAYARENNLEWCEDESNSDVKFARNKVRHEYLPHLEETNPGATMQLCKVARLADKAYAKVMEKCNELFNPIVSLEKEMPELVGHDKSLDPSTPRYSAQDDTSLTTRPSSLISLNKKALRKIFRANADVDLSEMFRLWLSELGFRFPIGFFYDPKEPAHIKIPHRASYRKRSIVKIGSTVLICEFKDVAEASKFVFCGMKE